MICWWCLGILTANLIQAQNPFNLGASSLDPFLEMASSVGGASDNLKSNLSDSLCVSNGALIGSIIGTLLLSALITFLIWMIYLRQKLQDLQSYENRGKKQTKTSSKQRHAIVSDANDKLQYQKEHTIDDRPNPKNTQSSVDTPDYKFGTFPFRQMHTPSVNSHHNVTNWFNRFPSSFRSVSMDQDTQTIDIELLNPTFCGLNFSIMGNMRSGIFVKEILDKNTADGQIKLNSSDQLRTGDHIIALTVCFESIVYEDALTILSYASPYPVILRVQRPRHSSKVNELAEKQSVKTTKVQWRDDLEHYDNDISFNHSLGQLNSTATLITDTKSMPSATHHLPSSKKPPSNKSPSIMKTNKLDTTSKKRSNIASKNPRHITMKQMILTSTGLAAEPNDKTSSLNKTTTKSVTNTVMSYLHHRGTSGGHLTDTTNKSEAILMPYYDSPYDCHGAQISQVQLNKNNNNSASIEPFTPARSVYTIQLSPTRSTHSNDRTMIPRLCQRRLSSATISLPPITNKTEQKDISIENIDTFV